MTLRGAVETPLGKLTALRNLSFQTLRDEKDVAQTLCGFKINLTLLTSINSDETRVVVDLINGKLDDVTKQIGDIQGRIGKQKSKVARLIKANQDEINEFLKSAGYRYSVQIEPSQGSYRMILEHQDAAGYLESAAGHLSYGEKNAFALILFMHQVRKEQPDLVVFDDPVSSFDKTKKFAIFHQLFRGKHSLRDFTTLLLTHDIEPAIDIVKTGTSRHFTAAKPVVHFLSSRRGVVSEKLIQKSDLSTFSQVCDANIEVSSDDIIKCIYLRRRYEVHGKLESEYDVLSSLLHVRETPSSKAEDGALTPIDGDDLAKAVDSIRKVIPSFEYGAMIQDLQDSRKLKAKFDATDIGYEKLQLFRVMSERDSNGLDGDDVFHKFVNESFHIENEYVMQLNPREFDTVPEYIIDACSALVAARSVV